MAIKTIEFSGFEVVYGTSAGDNDTVSLELAQPNDFWFHASGYAGSHVIVRNPTDLTELPKEVERYAAGLAVAHSKAKAAKGKVEVHLTWARNVKKPRGFSTGKVQISSYRSLKVYSPSES